LAEIARYVNWVVSIFQRVVATPDPQPGRHPVFIIGAASIAGKSSRAISSMGRVFRDVPGKIDNWLRDDEGETSELAGVEGLVIYAICAGITT